MGRKRKVVRRRLVPAEVLQRLSYIDTIHIILRTSIGADQYKSLFSLCIGETRTRRSEYGPGRFHNIVELHRPTREAIEMLRSITQDVDDAVRIVRVDIALDLVTATETESQLLQDYMLGGFMPTASPRVPVKFVNSTGYFNKDTKAGEVFVLYSDRPCKVNGRPCLHVESRIKGAAALRRIGLRDFQGILDLNYTEFWRKRLRLQVMPSTTFAARAIVKQAQKSRSAAPLDDEAASKTDYYLRRLSTSYHDALVAHNYHIHLRTGLPLLKRVGRLFSKEPNDWALPPNENAVWRVAEDLSE